MVPNFYTKLFSYFHYKISILNCWATQVIAVLSGIHLFASCIIYLFFSPLSYNTLYAMTHIIPPLIYVICIIVNHAFVKTISLTYKKMPFYVSPLFAMERSMLLPAVIKVKNPASWTYLWKTTFMPARQIRINMPKK